MKNKKLIMMIMAIYLMGLSSCGNQNRGVTDAEIKSQIIEQFGVKDTTRKLHDLVIATQDVDATHIRVDTTFVLENDDANSTMKETLYYQYENSKWKYISSSWEFVSAITKNDGDPQQALTTVKTVTPDWMSMIMWGQFTEVSKMVPMPVQSDRNNGNAKYTFVTTTTMLDTTAVDTITIKAWYLYPTGWQYTVDSWTYIETTDFTGDYELASDAGTLGKAHLDGEMILITKLDGSIAYSNTITGNLEKDGKTFTISAEPFTDEWYTDNQVCSYYVKLNFGTEAEDYFVLLVESGGGRGGELNPPYWYGLVGFADRAWVNISK